MSEQKSNNHNDDRLSDLIDSLLSGNLSDADISEVLDQENEELLAAARQIIALSQYYPGPPELSPQDKLRFLTLFKAQDQKKQQPARSKLSAFVQQHRISLALPAGLVLVILFLVFRQTGGGLLPASAGVQSSALPVIILVVFAILIIILFLRKK